MRSYQFRIYPTAAQRARLAVEFGHARFVWNTALALRSQWYSRWGESVSGVDFSRELTWLKGFEPYAWLRDASSTVLTQKLRDLDTAFSNFFAGRARYPRFKKRAHAQSIRFQLDQRVVMNNFRAGELLKLPRLGALKVRWSRLPGGVPKMVTVRRDAAGRYFVAMMVEEDIQALPPRRNGVGVDLGIKALAVDSNGKPYANPRHLFQQLRKLKRAQRTLSRRRPGSGRWHAQRARVARLHARVRDARANTLHQLSWRLIRDNQVIALEDLHVRGMVRNRRLARAISDVGWRELRRQLEYKAQWYGREVIVIDRWAPTSKTCSDCGHIMEAMPLSVRAWACPACGAEHDRDVNAARNILSMATGGGPGLEARGGGTTPTAAVA